MGIDLQKKIAVSKKVTTYRRVVSDTNSEGKSVFTLDEVCHHAQSVMGMPEFATTELWRTYNTPVDLTAEEVDPAAGPAILDPPKGGSVFRVVEFPPDAAVIAAVPGVKVSDMVHRTNSIDYAYVLKGEIYATLDTGEKLLKAGDVMIQRGTRHGWSNRSKEPCLVLYVMIGATLPSP